MQFRKKFGEANVTSLVERVSRFTVFLRNNDRQSRPIMERLIRTLEPLPAIARRSITFDRGTDRLALSAGRTWGADLVLRPAIAVAERHRREHEPPRPKMAFEGG